MKVVVIVAVVLWCSPVLAFDVAEWNTGTSAAQAPTGTLTTGGNNLNTGGGLIDTFGGDIWMLGGNLLTEGGAITTEGGDIDAGTGSVTADSVTANTVTGLVVETSGGGVTLQDNTISGTIGNITTVNATDVNTTNVTATGTVEGATLQTDTLGVVISDGDIDATGTISLTDGAGVTVISGGALGVMNPNGGLLVDDTMAGMGYGGYSVICDDSGAIMEGGTNSVGVDETGAYMTDGTASVSTSGGEANMSSGGGDVTVTDTEVSVTVNNGEATHGLTVGVNQTSLSGGTGSTTLTLNDDEALLDNELNMDGNKITNVANGVHQYDAVNKGQLDDVAEMAYQGIAAVAAMSAIPQPMAGHRFAIGIGGGTYKDEGAFAIGGSANLTKNLRLTGSVGVTSDSAVGAAGVGFSW